MSKSERLFLLDHLGSTLNTRLDELITFWAHQPSLHDGLQWMWVVITQSRHHNSEYLRFGVPSHVNQSIFEQNIPFVEPSLERMDK